MHEKSIHLLYSQKIAPRFGLTTLAVASCHSGCGLNVLDILPNDPRMSGCDAQQCHRGTLGVSPTLLPVSESMNADAHGVGELRLSEPDKAP